MVLHNSMAKKSVQTHVSSLEDTLNEYFGKKAPQLPIGAKEAIVKFAPWVTLVLLVLGLPAVFLLFGLGALLTPFSYVVGGVHFGLSYTLSLIILAATLVLEALAIPLLMKRSKKGWNFIFYASLLGVVSNIVSFNLGSLIIGALISFYILFQIRSYYK